MSNDKKEENVSNLELFLRDGHTFLDEEKNPELEEEESAYDIAKHFYNDLGNLPASIVFEDGYSVDMQVYKKMADALVEAKDQYGFDMLIVDAKNISHTSNTIVMCLPENDTLCPEVQRFGAISDFDILSKMLADEQKKGDGINHLMRGTTFYTNKESLNLGNWAKYMNACLAKTNAEHEKYKQDSK